MREDVLIPISFSLSFPAFGIPRTAKGRDSFACRLPLLGYICSHWFLNEIGLVGVGSLAFIGCETVRFGNCDTFGIKSISCYYLLLSKDHMSHFCYI